ncbi:MAG: hypothetical protein EDM79_05360 [Chloroflexi bacterium]|nr:MAG: hypothetical protein EDM79_05360 [Chloroflexota bacterium]
MGIANDAAKINRSRTTHIQGEIAPKYGIFVIPHLELGMCDYHQGTADAFQYIQPLIAFLRVGHG